MTDVSFICIMLQKFKHKLKQFLKQGLTPRQIALTLSSGMLIGMSPLLGLTTIICLLIARIFKFNTGVIIAANYIVYPLQIIFMLPFFLAGARLFHSDIRINKAYLEEITSQNPFAIISTLGELYIYGTIIWLILAIPSFFILYYLLHIFLKKMKEQMQRRRNGRLNN